MSIASAALQANFEQRERFLQKILAIYPSLQAKRVGLVGLAFKPGTDDLRESPAVWLAEQLSQRGAQVLAFDPLCQTQPNCPNLKFTASFTELLAQDFLVIANDFAFLRKMHPQQFFKLTDHRIFDGRNCFRANYFAKTVVEYYCIGRKAFICK
jgi:UDPglucose 6-dehydrogenase